MSQAMTLDNILTLCEMPESVINMSPEDALGYWDSMHRSSCSSC